LSKSVTLIIRGKAFSIAKENVEKVLEKLEPEPLQGRAKYYIEYKGRKYPIRQVVAAVAGLPRPEVTTTRAYRVLTELGFEVKELKW